MTFVKIIGNLHLSTSSIVCVDYKIYKGYRSSFVQWPNVKEILTDGDKLSNNINTLWNYEKLNDSVKTIYENKSKFFLCYKSNINFASLNKLLEYFGL